MNFKLEQKITIEMDYDLLMELEDELRELLNNASNRQDFQTDDYDLSFRFYEQIRQLRKKGARSA